MKFRFALPALLTALSLHPAGHTVTWSWTASKSSTPSAPGTYNLYIRNASCPTTQPVDTTGFTRVNTAPISGTSYVQTAVPPGTYCGIATFTQAGVESAPSNTAPAPVPLAPPTGLKPSIVSMRQVQVPDSVKQLNSN